MENTTNTKRIAKNTLMLYIRQILILIVSLFTVRIILNVLGAEDYGIYNVVAGVVVLFSFINNAMASSTQRFLNFSMGQNDKNKTQNVFSTSLVIHISISGIFIVLAETIGLWFVICKLNIPVERKSAALWTYQFAIITSVFNILKVPYNAVIIAHEEMRVFAEISILEVLLKLSIVFLLKFFGNDKLIFYSILLTIVQIIVFFVYKIYCNLKFEIAHYKKHSEKKLIKELIGFSGWSLLGAVANVCNSQGTNMVLNIFTNVTVNAAMGIANQVNNAVYSFVGSFQTAFNPQIVKTYAADEKDEFIKLIFRTSKFSFLLLYLIVLPLYLNIDLVLSVWLKNVPDYSAEFVKLMLIWSLIDAINGPLWMSVQATGKIRNYQIIVSSLIFANLPFSILAFKFGASPYCILYIRIILNVITTFWRVFYLKHKINLPSWNYILNVICRCLAVAIVAYIGSNVVYNLFSGVPQFFVSCIVSVILNILLGFFICLTKDERVSLNKMIHSKLGKNNE